MCPEMIFFETGGHNKVCRWIRHDMEIGILQVFSGHNTVVWLVQANQSQKQSYNQSNETRTRLGLGKGNLTRDPARTRKWLGGDSVVTRQSEKILKFLDFLGFKEHSMHPLLNKA